MIVFTEAEDKYIIDHYANQSQKEIADALERTTKEINYRLWALSRKKLLKRNKRNFVVKTVDPPMPVVKRLPELGANVTGYSAIQGGRKKGVVVWVHPLGRFCVMKYESIHGKHYLNECFMPGDLRTGG